ncbi:MAG: hypothetical protein KJ676_01345 [Alphaproteobacteria bacterium]|nr:hypothetical protein [Alphaproteobacteria bacterium]MBU2117273.1 hypothetical protein [Alphaproteobacteria bacterium]MBU2352434.1 hypothetical protein [Alphaproteobacteria bacterium]MBU2381868.1 hypothetical protein [Alphaproteobacteria bacterium]
MRLLALTAAVCALAGPASAQVFAIDQRVPLKVVGDTDEFVTLAQIPAGGQAPGAPFDSWVWTFMREPQLSGVARFDASAVLTRFDCRAGTRQRLRYEFYISEVAVNDTAHSEAPARPVAGSPEAAALRTVCEPGFNPTLTVYPAGARGVRRQVQQFWAGVAPDTSGWALDRRAPLKPTAETGEALGFVEVPADSRALSVPFEAWTWTFTKRMRPGPDGLWNGAATLTRFDCSAGTLRPLRMQFYQGETLIHELETSDSATVPAAGSMDDFALKTVCDPAFQANMPIDTRGARAVRTSVSGYFASLR